MRNIKVLLIIILLLLENDLYAWFSMNTLKGMTESSSLIVTGKVINITQKVEFDQETNNEQQYVFTYVTIKTEMILSGESKQPEITVKMLGGRTVGKGTWSELWLPFELDEEVLVFLFPYDKNNNIWEINCASGKLSIINSKGKPKYDCSVLFADEVSKYDTDYFIDKEIIIDRINKYMQTRKGGK